MRQFLFVSGHFNGEVISADVIAGGCFIERQVDTIDDWLTGRFSSVNSTSDDDVDIYSDCPHLGQFHFLVNFHSETQEK